MSAAYHIRWVDDHGEHREVVRDQGEAVGRFLAIVNTIDNEGVELIYSP